MVHQSYFQAPISKEDVCAAVGALYGSMAHRIHKVTAMIKLSISCTMTIEVFNRISA